MIKEFKGTKGNWVKYQNKEGDIEISAKGFYRLAIVNFYPNGFREKYINGKITGSPAPDSSNYRKECINNAKLIASAPELLEVLIELIELKQLKFNDGEYPSTEYLKRKPVAWENAKRVLDKVLS